MPGLTDSGFEIKSFSDIRTELEGSFDSLSGSSPFRKSSTSPIGQLIGIETKQLYDAWQLANDTYQSRFPDTSQGQSLDQVVSVAGLERKFGFRTSGVVYLSGSPSTNIPAGTLVSTANEINFSTQSTIILGNGAVPVIRIDKEPGNSATSFIITVTGGLGGLFSAISGRSETISYTATSSEVISSINTLFDESDAVDSVAVAASSVTITFNSARFMPDFSLINGNLTTVTQGLSDGAAIGVSATEDGPLVVSSFQVVNINSPISGLDSVINFEDFVVGRLTETDQELRSRWTERVQGAQISSEESIRNEVQNLSGVSQAVVFGGSGEIEVVVNGGSDEEIAQTIFNNKPAGISLSGSASVIVTDVNGNPKPVHFSRPTIRSFYVRVRIVKGEDFPVDGEEQIKGALISYVSSFRIGGSIRPTPDMIWVLDGITGINNLGIFISEDNVVFSSIPVQLSNRESISFNSITITSA